MRVPVKFIATAIGSFPHTDPEKALDIIFNSMPEAPAWPQLPRSGFNEQMEVQYTEGMPRVRIDHGQNRLCFDTSGDYSEEFALFYEQYLESMESDDPGPALSSMAISQDYSKGIYSLERRCIEAGARFPLIKVHTTGPCSFTLNVVDENKRALFYNEEFRDMACKALSMKCRWQIRTFKPYADNILCFIDEPILSAFGSSTYISVKREDVIGLISETVEAIHADGAIAGVHCCGNTEWSILIDAGVDLINFDAYEYGETVSLYPDEIRAFIQKGGVLAWGLVPTSKAVWDHDVDALVSRYSYLVDMLAAKTGCTEAAIHENAIVTPSCGTGSMDVKDAERVFELLGQLSRELRARF